MEWFPKFSYSGLIEGQSQLPRKTISTSPRNSPILILGDKELLMEGKML